MRNLIQTALLALVATVVLWVALRFTIPADAWFNAFLFDRSIVQWLSIAMFLFGALIMVGKTRQLATERRHLAGATWGQVDNPGESVVLRRISQVAEIAQHHSPSFCRDSAKDLADEDTRALNESYTMPADVIGTLPLVGFFGTVWGLSKGLYNNFVLQGEDSTNSFANAIGTAFDTTLLALFLTIGLTIAQSMLRRSELALLEKLDRYVESQLLKLDATGSSPVPSSNDPRIWLNELGIDPSELIGFLRGKLGAMAGDLQTLAGTQAQLNAAIDKLAAPPDPGLQLEALATTLRESTSQVQKLVQAQLDQSESLKKELARAQETNAAQAQQQSTALTAVAEILEKARAELTEAITTASGQIVAGTTKAAGEQTAALSALKELAAAQQSTLDALEQHNAAHRDALRELAEGNATGHRQTQDLLNRPKTFTVTEQPGRPDESPSK